MNFLICLWTRSFITTPCSWQTRITQPDPHPGWVSLLNYILVWRQPGALRMIFKKEHQKLTIVGMLSGHCPLIPWDHFYLKPQEKLPISNSGKAVLWTISLYLAESEDIEADHFFALATRKLKITFVVTSSTVVFTFYALTLPCFSLNFHFLNIYFLYIFFVHIPFKSHLQLIYNENRVKIYSKLWLTVSVIHQTTL